MKSLVTACTIGILSYFVYKFGIIDNLMQNLSIGKNNDNFTLLSINITEAEENFEKVSHELVSTFKTIGFAAVHGIKDFDGDELLKWTKWFFDLPLPNKMAIAKKAFNESSPVAYRGYTPIVPGTDSFKEAFEAGIFNGEFLSPGIPNVEDLRNTTTNENGRPYMRNIVEEKNTFPSSDNEADDIMFRNVMLKYYKLYKKVGDIIFKLMLHGFGFKPEQFPSFFCDKSLSTFRLLHYPTRLHNPASIPPDAWDGNQAMVTAAHFDTSMLTMLATFHYNGLEIRPPGFSKWIALPADKNTLLVNIGVLMSYLFERRIIATDHRVVDTGNDRYSVPFFYELCYDTALVKTFYGNENHLVAPYTKYGTWSVNRTSQFYEYATTDFGIPD